MSCISASSGSVTILASLPSVHSLHFLLRGFALYTPIMSSFYSARMTGIISGIVKATRLLQYRGDPRVVYYGKYDSMYPRFFPTFSNND